jgi:hypothetical protein
VRRAPFRNLFFSIDNLFDSMRLQVYFVPNIESGVGIKNLLRSGLAFWPVDHSEGHDSLCWMYGLPADVSRTGGSCHEHRVCFVPEVRMLIRSVDVWHDLLRIKQDDDVVSEKANRVDQKFFFR